MKRNVTKAIYLIVLLFLAVIAVVLLDSEEFDRVLPIEGDGNYLLHTQEQIPREAPDILIAEEGKLYLFYIDTELVNMYLDNGHYLYGIQFPDAQNDISDMTVKEGLLYVDARVSGIYVFRGTELIRFEEQSIYNDDYDELEALFPDEEDHSDGGYLYTYVEEKNCIIRSGHGSTEVVIQFPQRKFDAASFCMIATLMMVIGRFIWEEKNDTSSMLV